MLGDGYGVDKLGNVWLDASDDALHWAGYLLLLDMEEPRERKQYLQRVRDLEAAVGSAVGLSHIMAEPTVVTEPSCIDCLNRLTAYGQQHGPVGSRSFRDLALHIAAGAPSGPQEKHRQAFGVDENLGVLVVPVTAAPEQVYRHILENGPAVRARKTGKKAEAARVADLQARVRQKLRLRRLLRDPALPVDRFASACERLLGLAPAVGALLESASIRVSYVNQVAPDGSHIDIAWDFEV
eukprot:jgi/Botrbrau1/5870/Bobra.0366s0049.1